jgi:DNA-binding NarL/FixJ family response regulator
MSADAPTMRPALVVLAAEPGAGDFARMAARHAANEAGNGWAYLSKEAEAGEIAGAVRAAAAGLVALEASLALVLASGLSSDAAANPSEGELRRHARRAGAITNGAGETTSPGETLTAREIQVLQLMAQGLPNKIIAARLGISLHTAKFHVASILSKLGAASRTEAVTLGARHGFVAL